VSKHRKPLYTSPHISAERRLIAAVLTLAVFSALAVGAVVGDLWGATGLVCWPALVVWLVCAAAGRLKAGE
jgi:hypothetical protein